MVNAFEIPISDQESLMLKSEKCAAGFSMGFFISAAASFSKEFKAIEDANIGLFCLGLAFVCSAWAIRRISRSSALASASIGGCVFAVANVNLFFKNNWLKSESTVLESSDPFIFSLQ